MASAGQILGPALVTLSPARYRADRQNEWGLTEYWCRVIRLGIGQCETSHSFSLSARDELCKINVIL